MPLPERVQAFADAHHGLVTSAIARSDWPRFVGVHGLELIHRNVARIPDSLDVQLQRIEAAVLSVGCTALASHRSAAFLWGCEMPCDVIDITVARAARPRDREGVLAHRPRFRSDLAPSRRGGIACTNPLRTLADLGLVAPELVLPAMDTTILLGFATFTALSHAHDRHLQTGRAATTPFGNALRLWPLEDQRPDSQLEIDFARLLRAHRLTFEFHVPLEGFEVDFAIGRVIVETDGWEFHQSRDAFEQDRRRDAVLTAAGWRVLRFTWRQIHDDPTWVIGMLLAALAR